MIGSKPPDRGRHTALFWLLLLLGLATIVVMLQQWLAEVGLVTPFPS